jgi:hypothetical protein
MKAINRKKSGNKKWISILFSAVIAGVIAGCLALILYFVIGQLP